jgi:hypothetical protein
MNAIIRNNFSKIASALLAATFAVAVLPVAASAQAADQEVQGTIQSINGTFNISVLDSNGNIDNVELHQGTVINPTGLTLAPGMSVTIDGYDDGSGQFDANVINTPYQYSGPAPVPVYYGPGFWYPGFAYGYGPSFSLFVGFGGSPWLVRQPWGGHWWVGTPVHTFVGFHSPGVSVGVGAGYRAPERSYVAPGHYVAPAAHAYGGGYAAPRGYSAPRSYAAPARAYGGYSAPARSYSSYRAPAAAHYSGGGAHYSGGGGHYSGGGGHSRR